jgi:hypothetical protein
MPGAGTGQFLDAAPGRHLLVRTLGVHGPQPGLPRPPGRTAG